MEIFTYLTEETRNILQEITKLVLINQVSGNCHQSNRTFKKCSMFFDDLLFKKWRTQMLVWD
jgi:hypothetical protein